MQTMHKDFRGEAIYQAEVDVHFPQLTVGQTLDFAARARGKVLTVRFSRLLANGPPQLPAIGFPEVSHISLHSSGFTSLFSRLLDREIYRYLHQRMVVVSDLSRPLPDTFLLCSSRPLLTARPLVTRDRYAEHMRDVIMAIFGLSHTLNTKVGNDFIRGVSGGERKRVSIAEA